ncbi:MAG: RNA polymerase sigma factor SigE [Acidimicrobiia bacterium]|nr:MAG: RNA polymerase sigma factor SigE [Acidimicrobiia bacterium]
MQAVLGSTGDEPVAVGAVVLPFDEFYAAEYAPLARLGFVLTGSRPVAEELTQETMLRAYRHWRKVSAYEKPGAWARRVLCNLATSRGRRLTAEARAIVRLRNGRDAAPEPGPESSELWAEVRELPARQAQVLALHYVEDLSVAEIAEHLECPEGTVKSLLHRGRTALAQRLGGADEVAR